MRLLSTLCLSLLLGASGTAAMASSKASFAKKFKNADIHRLVSVPGMVDRSNSAYQMRQAGFANISNAPTRVGDTPTNSASGEAYGWITGSDGGNWYFTQSIVSRDSVFSEYYTAHFHESSEITLFDNNHKQVGSFSVKVMKDGSMYKTSLHTVLLPRNFSIRTGSLTKSWWSSTMPSTAKTSI